MLTTVASAPDVTAEHLIAVLVGAEGMPRAADEARALVDLAAAHAVQPLLAERLLTRGSASALPADIDATLRRVQWETSHRNARRLQQFAEIVTALQNRGIDVVALKGIHLVPLVYKRLAVRSMTDIDLLVRATDLRAAGDELQRLGYHASSPYLVADDYIPYFHHHLPPFHRQGASPVELHWSLCRRGTSVSVDMPGLFDRAITARIGGVETRVLGTEDLLLHLVEHALYHHKGTVSVRACCDMSEILRSQPVQWDALVDRSRSWNIVAGTYLMLRLAQQALGAAVPVQVLDQLAPDAFDERLLSWALQRDAPETTGERFRRVRGIRPKLRVAREYLFVGHDELADRHATSRSSPLVYALYVRRAANLLRRWREFGMATGAHRSPDAAAAVEQLVRPAWPERRGRRNWT